MSNAADAHTREVSSGVDTLITRLREEGVNEGRTRAEEIVNDAETRAKWIVSQAQEEAERVIRNARDEAKRGRTAAEEAMQVAARDALLSVKADLTHQFARKVQRLVSDRVSKEEMLEKMILELVGRMREEVGEDQQAEVILPRDVVGVDDLRRNIEELKEGSLSHFVLAQTSDMVREGVRFGVSEDDQGGLRIALRNGEITLDMTDKAVADLLLAHLQPRFRALLEGIVG